LPPDAFASSHKSTSGNVIRSHEEID